MTLLHLTDVTFHCTLPTPLLHVPFVSPAGIGPPSSVNLAPAGSNLEVVIVDPLTSANSSMREYIKDLKYNILYWEQDGDEQVWHKRLHFFFFRFLCRHSAGCSFCSTSSLFYSETAARTFTCVFVGFSSCSRVMCFLSVAQIVVFVLANVSHLWF